jgi:alkylation response protein AidB-like acyl-CoA dehydrogenase
MSSAPSITPSISEFRAQVRAFHEGLAVRLPGIPEGDEPMRAYRLALDQAGLSGITIPVDLGGRGLPDEYERAFQEEKGGRLVPEEAGLAIGIGMALPTILDHGSPALQQRFVPSGLRGEEIWCQLYSEPGAGSDLAGLTTRAIRDGDEWVVTGQKVWTSGAQHADLGILLARTDPDLPKHRGITMFVIDMHQPAVEVRPLVQMTGASEFNEVFLDEARVPAEWVVGEVEGGWRIAIALLSHERSALGGGQTATGGSKAGRNPLPFDGLVELARHRDLLDDPLVRQELAAIHTGELVRAWLTHRGLHPSIGKLWRTIQGRRAAQLAHLLGGPRAVAWEIDDAEADYFAYHVLNCRGMSLGGGTDEIQRNTLGERVLGLPREPGPDRDTPFRDLLTNDG